MQTDEQPRIEQLLHGYRRGHRLLAGSEHPSPETTALIDRLSDAAAGLDAKEPTYLTAYPLPDGRYAFARTWRAHSAPRPNTVWTHTLILDALALSTTRLQDLVVMFAEPSSEDLLDGYMNRIALVNRHAQVPMSGDALSPGNGNVRRALAGLYLSSRRPVRIACTESVDRERLAISIWDQMWPTARQRATFCTAWDVQRSLEKQPFDLLFGSDPEESELADDSPIVQTLAFDIQSPGPLRDFLQFVGSGVGDLGTMQLFVLAWQVTSSLGPPQDGLHSLAALLRGAAPQHRQLRRLKRALFGTPAKGRLQANPIQVLGLLTEELRTVVAAEDASLAGWFEQAWHTDTQATIRLAKRELRGRGKNDDTSPETVGAALHQTIHKTLPPLVTARSLPLLARELPEQLIPILCARRSENLWKAWTALDDSLLQATIRSANFARVGRSDLESIVRALLVHPSTDAAENLNSILAKRKGDRLDILVTCLLELPAKRLELWRDRLGIEPHAVAVALQNEAVPERISVLSAFASPDELPTKVRVQAWSDLLDQDPNDRVAALVYLIGRGATRPSERKLGASSYALLYDRLAKSKSDDAWNLLDSRLAGQKGDWDRCKRLARDWSKSIQEIPASELAQLLRLVQLRSNSAAQAATNAFSKRKNRSILDRALELLGW
jgi:hypothetical protein